ncbi:EpsD family peptidyl-prolyl cis-trans isomerase [Massilia sp. PWRC2]|uniref:EpsD family peptidyl-prolyl cis-trans isomerase n=1 Tax=Massilia sp. PWRC2 TaxID=2804626 RepID=UPI003CE69209
MRRPVASALARPGAVAATAALATLAMTATLAALVLAACGQSASADAKAVRSLPLASVNDVRISLLAAADAIRAPGDQAQLEALIDKQLLQEEAIRNKLDRNALVLQAIERAKTDILAKAQLQSKVAAAAAPTSAEIAAYFSAHPQLFSGRKFFYIKELVLDSKDFTPQLQRLVEGVRSIEQVARWLDARKVPYQRDQQARSSAELAPEMLAQLDGMRELTLFVVKAGPNTMIDALQGVSPSPVTAAAAVPQIDAFLRNKQRQHISEAEIARLRKLATITYFNQQQATAPLVSVGAPHNQEKQ